VSGWRNRQIEIEHLFGDLVGIDRIFARRDRLLHPLDAGRSSGAPWAAIREAGVAMVSATIEAPA
jgi:hypothetical protein